MDVQDVATLSLVGWCLILTGLILTFVQNAVPNHALGAVNRVIEAAASLTVDWFDADKEKRLVIVGLIICLVIFALYDGGLLPEPIENLLNHALALANDVARRVPVPGLWKLIAFCGAVGVTIYLPVLIFVWLSRLHPGGAIGVVGLLLDTPRIVNDAILIFR